MPEFVLNRTYVLPGNGHMIRFEKGQPTYVPPSMVKAAVAIGAECVQGPQDVLGPEETPVVQLSAEEKEVLMFKAFGKLVERNERDDFGGDGKPTLDALRKIVDFPITKKEVVVWYQAYRESQAAAA